VKSCSPKELREKLHGADEFLLLDVRNDDEYELVHLDRALHIPMSNLKDRLHELDPWKDKEIVVMCHHGVRSLMALEYLVNEGFQHVKNLVGGIDAYAVEADAKITRY
jgi:rhodanese-related sulfurtransferase